MRGLIIVMIALLAMASSTLAQDTFNVNTNPANPSAHTNPIAETCNPPYDATMEKLNEQDAQAEGQLRKDVVDCNSNHGSFHRRTDSPKAPFLLHPW